MPVWPFRVFGIGCSNPGVATRVRPLFGLARSFRVTDPLRYRPYGLGDPTLPLAVSSAVWFSSRRASAGHRYASSQVLSSSLNLRLESYPAIT
jgi:hypothetical protein